MVKLCCKSENNELIKYIEIQKSELDRIIKLESEVPDSLRKIHESTKNLASSDIIKIYDEPAQFVFDLYWIVVDILHDKFNDYELGLIINCIKKIMFSYQEKVQIFSKDKDRNREKETLKILRAEVKKYKYMLSDLSKLYVLKSKELTKKK